MIEAWGRVTAAYYARLRQAGWDGHIGPHVTALLSERENAAWSEALYREELGYERDPASPLWNPHAPETWDDPLAVDERENPLPGNGR